MDYEPCLNFVVRERGMCVRCCAETLAPIPTGGATAILEQCYRLFESNIRKYGVRTYPYLKPFFPKHLRMYLRKRFAARIYKKYQATWPIDESAVRPPGNWDGWPEGKQFALVLTHDVETKAGLKKCYSLADMELQYGFRSSFNFVAEDYETPLELMTFLAENGFEVGLHGVTHRGNMFRSKKIFTEYASRANHYLMKWGSVGFRSPCMYHNLGMLHELEIEYDTSTFDVDPFEPQPDGAGTIFPFVVRNQTGVKEYVELPYTLAQDSTCFILLGEKDIEIWKSKLAWIARHGGLALVNVHPDYMAFDGKRPGFCEYPARYYQQLLEHLLEKYGGQYWHTLPRDAARFYKHTRTIHDGDGGCK